jgi:phospholipid/cholesterol/gamma-HCH transport system substrate-binding protein
MKIRNELKAGIFVGASLFLVGFLILIMGRERQIFATQVEFFTTFKDVKGLAVGAPVRLGGIPVGRVANVGFAKEPSDFRVHVTLSINESFLDRMRTDLSVSIETAGLLGDRFVAIAPGHSLDVLPPGSVLQATEVSDITQVMARAQTMVQNTTEISDRINKALEGLSPQSISNFSDAAKGVAVLLKDIKNEKGFLNRLIYSEEEGGKLVKGVTKATQDVSDLIGEVKSGSGFLHALIYSQKGDETVQGFSKTVASIGKATDELSTLLLAAREGKGLVHDLVYTDVSPGEVSRRIADVLKELNQTVHNLKAASDALANGTGTLGALLVDPQLYDNLVEVTDGAKRSFLLRQAIRSSLKQ